MEFMENLIKVIVNVIISVVVGCGIIWLAKNI